MKVLSLLVFLLGIAATASAQAQQGIRGTVVFKSGNLMPGPGRTPPAGKPVRRELFVYEPTKMAQMKTRADGFYEAVQTRLIKRAWSDQQGRFRITLPPGQYSVLVKEPEKGLFANVFDGEMNAFPVEVKAGRFTTVSLEINYAAAY